MGKVPLKTVLCAVFCVGGVVYLGGCMAPIDLGAFVNDAGVASIIEKSGSVKLRDAGFDSDDDLEPGNKKITGLKKGKYYMVEEWDDTRVFKGYQFVSASGERTEKVANIGMAAEGGEITGLTNNYTYRVRSAGRLLDNNGDLYKVPYSVTYPPAAPSGVPAEQDAEGVITLFGPEGEDDDDYEYLLTPPASPSYEIAEIPLTPAGSAASSTPARRRGNNFITWVGLDTKTDYVFFRKSEATDPKDSAPYTYDFYVLRVASIPGEIIPPEPEDLTVNITLSSSWGDNPVDPELTAERVTYPQNFTGTINFNVNDPSQYTGFIWYIDGEQAGTGTYLPLTLKSGEVQYRIVGTYTVTVIATKGGKPYSATIGVEVTE